MIVKKIEIKNARLDNLLVECKLAESKVEAKRLIEQGGVEISGEKITDPYKTIEIKDDIVIQVGKRRFVKIKK